MGSGASVLCGGRPQLQLFCIDMRMAWCNGLVMFEDGTVRSIDHHEEEEMPNIEMVDSDEVELVSDTDIEDYDYEVSEEEDIIIQRNVFWMGRDYDRN